jgi:hypothetical protein
MREMLESVRPSARTLAFWARGSSHLRCPHRPSSPAPLDAALFVSLMPSFILHLHHIRAPSATCGQAAGEGLSLARHRRSWPLPSRATILGRQLTRTGYSPVYFASFGRRTNNTCFKSMFQVLQMFRRYVAKVDQNVAYVVMVIYTCCKLLFPIFYLFFRRML